MKLNIMIAVLLVALTFKSYSELINLNPDPDGEPWIVGGYKYTEKAEEIYNALPRVEITEEGRNTELKGMVDNSIGTAPGMPGYYFRPVFDQGGYGNCVHAAVIGYAFTYEINWLRKIQTPATEIENQYPINYSYNYWWWGTDGSSIGTEMHTAFDTAIEYGIPSSVIWEEVTGDSLTGNAIQWMSGYDKYYNAMNNRGLERVQFSDLSDPTNNFQNFNDLKIYLANHGIGDIVGGLAVFAFDMENARFRKIPPEYYMGEKAIIFSTDNDFDHAMTIVGYDDNVAYDFVVEYYTDDTGLSHKIPPSNEEWKWDSENHCIIKTPKPMTEWEVGALKIANSWGEGWYHKIDEGFIYLPYRLVAQGKTSEVSAIVPVNDNTFPETQIVDLTYKVSLSHDLRNKMANSIAMTVDPNSELGDPYVPEKQFITSQAKKGGPYPMQGINSNPIEFGLDVTEFYRDEFKSPSDLYYPKKYFFIIDDITSAQPAIPNEILSFELYDH
ncbi:MAG: hypothetical protein L6407_04145, partial [Candidatus Delongbacteria bacterium]|nr:hypothetical protein [Candidatus Delongbacteria bacterium]